QQEAGLQDVFGQEAWNALRQHPTQPFYRFEDVQGRRSLRYATADLMRPSCVNCHNTHPASLKTDWQTGDVRGVLEVILPLDVAVVQTRAGLRGTFGLMMVTAALGLSGLALVIGRLRRSAADLEQHARALQNEISERRQAEEALRQALAAAEVSQDELERFNRFAIGRELRMIELKQQVNALLIARGEPAMYTIDATEDEPT